MQAIKEKAKDLSHVIARDEEIMGGTPCFEGTRVPIHALFDHLESGETIDSFFEGYPRVTRAQVFTVLEAAKTSIL